MYKINNVAWQQYESYITFAFQISSIFYDFMLGLLIF